MNKYEIVNQLAQGQQVETLIKNLAHVDKLSADLKDLSQMVYLILLEYDEQKVIDIYCHKQMRFFLVRVILNQLVSVNSPYYSQIRKFAAHSAQISEFKENGE